MESCCNQSVSICSIRDYSAGVKRLLKLKLGLLSSVSVKISGVVSECCLEWVAIQNETMVNTSIQVLILVPLPAFLGVHSKYTQTLRTAILWFINTINTININTINTRRGFYQNYWSRQGCFWLIRQFMTECTG